MSAARPVAPSRRAPSPRQLQRCLLLAALLHVWLVLMFGNTTGSPQAGQGGWGSLTVRLGGRSGGSGDAPAAPARPGAARGGTPDANPARPPAPRAQPAATASADGGESPAPATRRLPDGFRPIEQEALRVPPAELALPALSEPPALPAPVNRLEAAEEATAAATPAMPSAASLRSSPRAAELPLVSPALPAPVQRLEATSPVRDAAAAPLPRPADLRASPPAAAALAPGVELPAPVRRLEAATSAPTATPLPRAAALRQQAPPTLAEASAATPLPAPVQRLEAPADGAAGLARLAQPAALRDLAPQTAAAAAGPQDLPPPVRQLEAPEAAGVVAPLEPGSNPRSFAAPSPAAKADDLRAGLPGEVVAPAGPVSGTPALAGTPGTAGSAGTVPGTGSQPGPGQAAEPAAAASASRPPLNLSLPRGDMTARRSPGLVELLPPPPKPRDKVEEALKQAGRPDCRRAYGGGLLAIVPLVVDTVRDKGCKW